MCRPSWWASALQAAWPSPVDWRLGRRANWLVRHHVVDVRSGFWRWRRHGQKAGVQLDEALKASRSRRPTRGATYHYYWWATGGASDTQIGR
jgi:hypothetical protein